jgi:chromosome segregation protein
MELDDAIKLLDETIDTSKTKIDNLKKSIQDLGNINVDAIEQYNVIKERYDFYKEQKEDLEDSIKQINQIIISLEQNMVVEFEKSFCEINSKFDEVFKILFGGGSGKLILTDESNMLASDIDINVQPPGKKVKSISVLSGGEKALSAIAILVPFCVLDEIDAPLDDANIIRFITLLNILSKQTQFITITHRRGTMEASEYIYGVTMQDKGVSKIISLKLEEAKEYIEN